MVRPPPTPGPSQSDLGGGDDDWVHGDRVQPRRNGVHRHLSINVGNLTVEEAALAKTESLFALASQLGANTVTFQEHGLNPRVLPRHEQWAERCDGLVEQQISKISWNVNECTTSSRLWGGVGTIILGTAISRLIKFGEDPSGLGRWNWSYLRGVGGRNVRLISVYVPTVSESTGNDRVEAQHERYFNIQKRDGTVLAIYWEDLAKDLSKWYESGDQILLSGDVNVEVTDPSITAFFAQFDMRNVLIDLHFLHKNTDFFHF